MRNRKPLPAPLPSPNAEVVSGELGGETGVRGILCNPIYAGVAPYPAMVSDEQWIRAACEQIRQEGPEQFLVNMLYCLKQTMQFANEIRQ